MQVSLESMKRASTELEKHLLFLLWLSGECKKRSRRPPVLVGGSAVEVYTYGHYMSGDIDLVGNRELIKEILLSTGYFKEYGRLFISEELGLFVEVPDHRLEGDYERVRKLKIEGLEGEVYVIGVEDLILDRLSACKFWKSEGDCLVAEFLLKKYAEELDMDYLQRQAQERHVFDELEAIIHRYEGNPPTP